jgi:hypothetical protein
MSAGMENMLLACLFVLACMAFYKFGLPVLKRMDDHNVRRAAQEESDISDPDAHIRHAMEMADEQVEDVQDVRRGKAVQYLFETVLYASRDEAEEARAERVGIIARRFYQDLPAALAGSKPRGRMSARERASDKWGRRKNQSYH